MNLVNVNWWRRLKKGNLLPIPNLWSTWNTFLSPTTAPLTNLVLSRVMLACRKAIRSIPVPLRVVGGPSALIPPLGSSLWPFAAMWLLSSRVVISSITSPYVNLLWRVKFCKKEYVWFKIFCRTEHEDYATEYWQAYLSYVSFHSSSINPNWWYFVNTWSSSEHRAKFAAVEAARFECTVTRIVNTVQIWMYIIELKRKIILQARRSSDRYGVKKTS